MTAKTEVKRRADEILVEEQLSARIADHVAAVVVTFNSENVVDSCLAPLGPLSVFVIDNASSDGTCARAARYPHVEVVRNTSNVGLAAAVNQGLALVGERDVLILNPDVIAPVGEVGRLHAQLARMPGVGILAPRLVGPTGHVQPSARTFQSPSVVLARRSRRILPRKRRSILRKYLGPSYVEETSSVPWVLGAAMVVRRSAVEEVGGMDPGFFLYHEDQDWCIRMWRAGWQVALSPEVVVQHAYQRASRKHLSREFWHHAMSTVRFYRKYPELLVGGTVVPEGSASRLMEPVQILEDEL